MNVDYARLRSVTARQIAAALLEDGFSFRRQKGSHRRYAHPDGRRVTLSFHHASDTFPLLTLNSMIEIQARWSMEDLKRLGLLRD
ncbi:MAG: type II toxin-antitoxin system HicA family toxin [Candidatus Hydrogenedentes bacterium]|nr:type II toxin-antitoxin system HicA family toxin [Candidatus Hydrogenedentota bacterium]